jgi:hypothetical protein
MKKSILIKSLVFFTAFPAYVSAQEKEITLEPVEIRVTLDKVPPAVKAAVVRDFGEEHQPVVWANSHSKFDTWGWEQTVNADRMEINYYTIHTHQSNGSYLEAVYTPDGKLVRSREEIKNFIPSKAILTSLQYSDYRDWKINKDVHIIKAYEGKTNKEHYAFKLEKGNQKKTVYFDKEGNLVENKSAL